LYRGQIFRHWRWGYLMAMQTTVLTRAAFERVGLFDTRYVNVSDHGFIALLCKHFEASFLSVPTAIKHEFAPDGRIPSEDHLATGKNRLTAAREMLRWCEELHLADAPGDPELRAIHDHRVFWLARLLTDSGHADEARALLRGRPRSTPTTWEARVLSACLDFAPGNAWPTRMARASEIAVRIARSVARRMQLTCLAFLDLAFLEDLLLLNG
jgi:hypothetical protein